MKYWFLFLILWLTSPIQAFQTPQCDVPIQDLSPILHVTPQRTYDPDSKEPIFRYAKVFPDGEILIVEQKHCLMANLSISLLATADKNLQRQVARIAQILRQTPTWKRAFGETDPQPKLEQALGALDANTCKSHGCVSSLDTVLQSDSQNTESLLQYLPLDATVQPFSSLLSIYLAVGGE